MSRRWLLGLLLLSLPAACGSRRAAPAASPASAASAGGAASPASAASAGGAGADGAGADGAGADDATPGSTSRPSVEECKAASDRVVEVTLLAFDDDPVFRAEIMGEVRERPPGERELRCHAEATPEQVACLAKVSDVEMLLVCAPPVDRCLRSDKQDERACAAMEREWGWGADLLASALEG